MRATLTFLLVLGLTISNVVQAQDSVQPVSVPSDVWDAVSPVLEAAREDSIPVGVLESKVMEGAAKGVPADRIRLVTERLSDELRSARDFLRIELSAIDVTDGEIAGTAAAIRNGVTTSAIKSLWENRQRTETLEIPLAVVGELVRRGISADEAARLMNRLLESGVPLQTAAQIPVRVDAFLPTAGAADAALMEAIRSLGIGAEPQRGRGPRP